MAFEQETIKEALPKPPTRDEIDLLRSMTELDPQRPPTCTVIYGNVGTGKTISGMEMLWEVVPKDEYILYVGSANGHTSFNNHPKYFGRMPNGKRRVLVMQYENQEQLILLAEALRKGRKSGEGNFAKIGGVILDELTTMSIKDAKWILAKRVEQAEKRGDFKDPYVAALPDHGATYSRTSAVVEAYTTLNMHVMFICHERIHDKTGQIVPDFGDKTAKAVYKDCHGVFFADVKTRKPGEKFVSELNFQPSRRFLAKNRIGGLGATGTIQQVIEAYFKWGLSDEEGSAMEPLKEEEVANAELPKIVTVTETATVPELT